MTDLYTDPDGFIQRWFRERTKPVVGLTIARMRRGKRVVIPPEWRGKTNSKRHRSRRNTEPRELTLQERRAPTANSSEWE